MGRLRDALFLLPALLLCILTPQLVTFVPSQLIARPPPSPSRVGIATDAPRRTTPTTVMGLSGTMLLVAAAAAAARAHRVVMRSQGQGGRFNHGQMFMPQLKGAKKKHILRKRKLYGSHSARQVPRRYDLYDKLEEYDKILPTYTILSEPDEPMQPVMDVPLLERYPWAGSLEKVPKKKQELESNTETGLEPYFGSFTRQNLPPQGRRQQYVYRRGWPSYHYPPWLNKPLIGTELKFPKNNPWKKDRRPERWQLPRKERLALERREAKELAAKEAVMDEMGDEEDEEEDDLDALLGTDEEDE